MLGTVGAVPAPVVRCTVDDPRLTELSGLVVDGDRTWAVADGGRRVAVHRLDGCAVAQTRTAEIDPYDVEDLALGADGALWVADTGDNERRRESIAVIVLPPRGEPSLHRLTYPDGPHDAEALLVDDRGRPLIVTKETGAPAGVYSPELPLEGPGPTPLVRVGSVVPPASGTQGGPIGGLGSRVVTGAARSADGGVVALRTYTDAWLYPVPDGADLAGALAGSPVSVPLPGEPQGEAVAFDPDGTLLSASEARGGERGALRAVAGAAGLVAPAGGPTTAAGTAPPGDAAAGGGRPSVAEPVRPAWWPAAIGGGAAAGLLALVAVALGVRAARRR